MSPTQVKHFGWTVNLLDWWFHKCIQHHDEKLCSHPKIKLPPQGVRSVKLQNRVLILQHFKIREHCMLEVTFLVHSCNVEYSL